MLWLGPSLVRCRPSFESSYPLGPKILVEVICMNAFSPNVPPKTGSPIRYRDERGIPPIGRGPHPKPLEAGDRHKRGGPLGKEAFRREEDKRRKRPDGSTPPPPHHEGPEEGV